MKKFLLPLIILSLLIQILHLSFYSGNPTIQVPIIDSQEYYKIALFDLDPAYKTSEPYFHSPLYPWFIALLFKIGGHSLVLVRIVQMFLYILSVILVYLIGKKYFSETTAGIASLVWILYGPALFFFSEILNVSLVLPLNLLTLYLLIIAREKVSVPLIFCAGLAGGLSAITRPDVLPFLGVAALLIVWENIPKKKSGTRFTFAGIFLIGICLPLLIVGAKNYGVCKKFIVLPANSGIGFYIGNNPDYKNTIGIRPGPSWKALTSLPFHGRTPANPSDFDNSAFYYTKAFSFITHDPAGYCRCLWYKIRTLVNGYELPETFDLYMMSGYSPVLRVLVWKAGGLYFPYSLLLPLALIGCIVTWKKRGRPGLLFVYLLMYAAALLVYWNSSRYRMAIVPVLVLFSAAAITWLVEKFHEKKYKVAGCVLSIGCIGGLIINIPYDHFSRSFNFKAEMLAAVGSSLVENGNGSKEISFLKQSIALNPVSADTRVNLVQALEREKNYPEAVEQCATAVHLNPDDDLIHFIYGRLLSKLGRRDDAIREFTEAIRCNRENEDAYYYLGNTLFESGRYPEAAEQFMQVCQLNPRHAEAHFNRGIILEKLNRSDEAVVEFLESVKYRPSPETYNKIGVYFASRARYDDAIRNFETALTLKPDWVEVRRNLELARGLVKQ
jgi:tetratricopeptide (TPR) repeat protein